MADLHNRAKQRLVKSGLKVNNSVIITKIQKEIMHPYAPSSSGTHSRVDDFAKVPGSMCVCVYRIQAWVRDRRALVPTNAFCYNPQTAVVRSTWHFCHILIWHFGQDFERKCTDVHYVLPRTSVTISTANSSHRQIS